MKLINNNVLDALKELPNESVDCIITSPPYYAKSINMVALLHNTVIESNCVVCGKRIHRNGNKPGRFCSLKCKGMWQHQQMPVSEEWLYEKYNKENLSTYQIAKLVHRNPKRVYEWLKESGIPTRTRAETLRANSYGHLVHNKIAPSPFMGKHHTGETRKILSQKASVPKPYLRGDKNGMYGVKGKEHPNWRGGSTPERQLVYSSIEWKRVAKAIWRRDKKTCQRCHIEYPYARFHIHHIISFINKETRFEPTNLILLCEACHRWVHSKKNVNKKWISSMPSNPNILEEVRNTDGGRC